MGCGSSRAVAGHQLVASPGSISQPFKDILDQPVLDSRKWRMLIQWTTWLEQDQFGYPQPAIGDIVGPNGRSKLGGVERPHDYQVSVSFPGADFDKGSEGNTANLTDHKGEFLASSGTEMAEALKRWLTEDWLDANQQMGHNHIFVCSESLKMCQGGVKAEGFRLYNAESEGSSTAILNENWAMYLRESFLESQVIIFIINEDWVDSAPCNQEFEALITRKRRFRPQNKNAIVFMDITDDKYNQRWGGKLPQLKEGMAYEAGKQFAVYQFTYNAQTTAADKLAVRTELAKVVAKHATKYPLEPGTEPYADLSLGFKNVHWPTWLYYGVMEGTAGWEPILEVRDRADDIKDASYDVRTLVSSRRFRIRMTGVTGDVFNEGYKIMCFKLELIDAETQTNIIQEGAGHFRLSGEVLSASNEHGLSMQHWCGTRQYSWIEWLVAEDKPPATVAKLVLHAGARNVVVEAMPVDSWPSHEAVINNFKPYGLKTDAAGGGQVLSKEQKWVALHTATEGTDATHDLPTDAPSCSQFRLRLLEHGPGDVAAGSVQIMARFPAHLCPIGGGVVTGSGGDTQMEDAAPHFAFNGDEQTRWVDVQGGGIGNVALWQYRHTGVFTLVEYSITSQINALTSYHSGLSGSPRDWTLSALDEAGTWNVVDQQRHVYFSTHRESKRFQLAAPATSQTFKLEFTAVAAGCASRSLQVGDIQLMAETPPSVRALEQHQLVVLSSATAPCVERAIQAAPSLPPPQFGLSWTCPTELAFKISVHPGQTSEANALGVMAQGQWAWTLGEGCVSNWYDWPLDVTPVPELQDDLDARVKTQPMLALRPRKEIITVDSMLKTSFRNEYTDNEVVLNYSHKRPFAVKGYGFHSSGGYVRADFRNWRLESQEADGAWLTVHEVVGYDFQCRSCPVLFYLPTNSTVSNKHRLVVTAFNGLVGLIAFQNLVLFTAGGEDDVLAVPRSEAAHLTLRLKPGQAPTGAVQPVSYVLKHLHGETVAPIKSWVFEGLTDV